MGTGQQCRKREEVGTCFADDPAKSIKEMKKYQHKHTKLLEQIAKGKEGKSLRARFA